MTGIIILAAGSSSRLGSPKQNLIFKGKTLLQHAIETALCAGSPTIGVVLGANGVKIEPTLSNYPISVFYNADWEEGMASSIRCGVIELQKIESQLTAILIMLCDQPFANLSIINQLLMQNSTKNGLVASAYNNTIGTPALFGKYFFPELLELKGHEGAKKILLKHRKQVISIPFPMGAVDIDTMEDYDQLNN